MLRYLFALGFVVGVVFLASPCQALITPGDITLHPSGQPTAETALTGQIQATAGAVSGAHSGDPNPPSPDDFFADAHTKVFADLKAGASGVFTLDQFNPNRTLPNGDPVGQLQGLLLYFTVHLKTGRQVFDNETNKVVNTAVLQIGTSLSVWSTNPAAGVNCAISPSASNSGSLAADPVPDFPSGFPNPNTLTPTQINAYSIGPDRLAAVIDPNAASSRDEVNAIHLDTESTSAAILAAFTGTGTVSFNYTSLLNTYHEVSSQGVIGWTISPKFDLEARVVYLYAGSVPEPASMGLLAAASMPLLARRLRKRKARLA